MRCAISSLILLVASSTTSFAVDCTAALNVRNYGVKQSSRAMLASYRYEYCEGDQSIANSSNQMGIDIVAKQIPISYTNGKTDSKEIMSAFCKNTFKLNLSSDDEFSYEDRVASDAMAAFVQCVRYSSFNRGVIVHEYNGLGQISIYLEANVTAPQSLLGVTATGAECAAANETGYVAIPQPPDGKPISIPKTLVVSCTRASQLAGNTTYNEASISILTSALPPYQITLSPVPSTDLKQQLAIEANDKYNNKLKEISGNIPRLITYYHFKELHSGEHDTAALKCPKGWKGVNIVIDKNGSERGIGTTDGPKGTPPAGYDAKKDAWYLHVWNHAGSQRGHQMFAAALTCERNDDLSKMF